MGSHALRTMFRSIIDHNKRNFHNTVGSPSEPVRRRLEEMRKMRRKRREYSKDDVLVEVPESTKWLDTPTWSGAFLLVGIAVFVKILMILDKKKGQERVERRMKEDPEMGTMRMLTREEWDIIQEIRPRTPFESAVARPTARIRTEDDTPVKMGDLKDWCIDVVSEALVRIEETASGKKK